jgi:hypothetical protein
VVRRKVEPGSASKVISVKAHCRGKSTASE